MPVTNYIYDGNQYLAEADENDTINRLYTNETDTYTRLVSQEGVSTGEPSYYHYDGQGNTRELTDKDENVSDTFTYDSWGTLLSRTGMTNVPFQFGGERGYYKDEELGTYYVMARVYDPSIIRWLSVDPLFALSVRNTASLPYSFLDNSPVMFIDPSGLFRVPICCEFSCGMPQEPNVFVRAWANNTNQDEIDKTCKWIAEFPVNTGVLPRGGNCVPIRGTVGRMCPPLPPKSSPPTPPLEFPKNDKGCEGLCLQISGLNSIDDCNLEIVDVKNCGGRFKEWVIRNQNPCNFTGFIPEIPKGEPARIENCSTGCICNYSSQVLRSVKGRVISLGETTFTVPKPIDLVVVELPAGCIITVKGTLTISADLVRLGCCKTP
jgi:RHS repeat-associated protein